MNKSTFRKKTKNDIESESRCWLSLAHFLSCLSRFLELRIDRRRHDLVTSGPIYHYASSNVQQSSVTKHMVRCEY